MDFFVALLLMWFVLLFAVVWGEFGGFLTSKSDGELKPLVYANAFERLGDNKYRLKSYELVPMADDQTYYFGRRETDFMKGFKVAAQPDFEVQWRYMFGAGGVYVNAGYTFDGISGLPDFGEDTDAAMFARAVFLDLAHSGEMLKRYKAQMIADADIMFNCVLKTRKVSYRKRACIRHYMRIYNRYANGKMIWHLHIWARLCGHNFGGNNV